LTIQPIHGFQVVFGINAIFTIYTFWLRGGGGSRHPGKKLISTKNIFPPKNPKCHCHRRHAAKPK
jgi:hypothetical protein